MFGFFAQKLTEANNHYIDWSRVAELVALPDQRYSHEELVARGKILAFTAMSSLLGAYFNQEDKTHYSNLTMGMLTGLVGAIVSHHIIAVQPLYHKRKKISAACDQLIQNIKMISLSEESSRQAEADIKEIMQLSLSDEKHARATETWGRRYHALLALKQKYESIMPAKALKTV